MTYEEALQQVRLAANQVREQVGDNEEECRRVLAERVSSDGKLYEACRLCGHLFLRSSQATRH